MVVELLTRLPLIERGRVTSTHVLILLLLLIDHALAAHGALLIEHTVTCRLVTDSLIESRRHYCMQRTAHSGLRKVRLRRRRVLFDAFIAHNYILHLE